MHSKDSKLHSLMDRSAEQDAARAWEEAQTSRCDKRTKFSASSIKGDVLHGVGVALQRPLELAGLVVPHLPHIRAISLLCMS